MQNEKCRMQNEKGGLNRILLRQKLLPRQEALHGGGLWRDELARQVGAICRKRRSGALGQRSRFRAGLRVVKVTSLWLTRPSSLPTSLKSAD